MPIVDEHGTPKTSETYARGKTALMEAQAIDVVDQKALLKQCFEDFVWVWEESLTYQPALRGVRRSFFIDSFRQLGELHPPASTYLNQQMTTLTSAVHDGQASEMAYLDLCALYRIFGRSKELIPLMYKLLDQQPDVANSVGAQCWMLWVHCHEWTLFHRYLPDFEMVLSFLKQVRSKMPAALVSLQSKKQPSILQQVARAQGIPTFDEIVEAYRQNGMDEAVQTLKKQEATLRAF